MVIMIYMVVAGTLHTVQKRCAYSMPTRCMAHLARHALLTRVDPSACRATFTCLGTEKSSAACFACCTKIMFLITEDNPPKVRIVDSGLCRFGYVRQALYWQIWSQMCRMKTHHADSSCARYGAECAICRLNMR